MADATRPIASFLTERDSIDLDAADAPDRLAALEARYFPGIALHDSRGLALRPDWAETCAHLWFYIDNIINQIDRRASLVRHVFRVRIDPDYQPAPRDAPRWPAEHVEWSVKHLDMGLTMGQLEEAANLALKEVYGVLARLGLYAIVPPPGRPKLDYTDAMTELHCYRHQLIDLEANSSSAPQAAEEAVEWMSGTKRSLLDQLGWSQGFHSKLKELEAGQAIELKEVTKPRGRSSWRMRVLDPGRAFGPGHKPASGRV